MTPQPTRYFRVLAIYPYRRGFAFAVLERGRLIDWGLARLYSKNQEEFIGRIEQMIRRYSVNSLAVEKEMNSRRSQHAKGKVARLETLAEELGVRHSPIAPSVVRSAIGLDTDATNHEVSDRLATYLPELCALLPQKRKFYEPEDDRSFVFRAVGLAVGSICA